MPSIVDTMPTKSTKAALSHNLHKNKYTHKILLSVRWAVDCALDCHVSFARERTISLRLIHFICSVGSSNLNSCHLSPWSTPQETATNVKRQMRNHIPQTILEQQCYSGYFRRINLLQFLAVGVPDRAGTTTICFHRIDFSLIDTKVCFLSEAEGRLSFYTYVSCELPLRRREEEIHHGG